MESSLTTRQIGARAEDIACHYLQQQGLQLLCKNFNCKMGEVDLIMQHGKYLVFVEVRLRKNPYYGDGLMSITRTKQRRLARTALYYLQQQRKLNSACRFDVVALAEAQKIDWIQNAFYI